MVRPSREEALVSTAFIWAERSTCDRLHVGAVFHREGRILVQGYNGAPAGLSHCNHECTCPGGKGLKEGEEIFHLTGCPMVTPCLRAAHAEQNGITWAARHGVALMGAELVVTHEPCYSCAMSIVNAGISYVEYVYPYRLHDGLHLMLEAGITVEQYLDWEEPRLVESTGDDETP